MTRFCVSEAEAATKWCPYARDEWNGGVEAQRVTNRYYAQDGKSLDPSVACIGSRCMAWRWVKTNVEGRDADGAPALVPSDDSHGYCGFAGDPR